MTKTAEVATPKETSADPSIARVISAEKLGPLEPPLDILKKDLDAEELVAANLYRAKYSAYRSGFAAGAKVGDRAAHCPRHPLPRRPPHPAIAPVLTAATPRHPRRVRLAPSSKMRRFVLALAAAAAVAARRRRST